jgi:hypothetical protein
VNKLPNGKTRLYVHEGNVGNDYSRLFRSDDAATAAPVFTDLTSSNTGSTGYGTFNRARASAGLTIVPGARKLYAATHGLGAWVLNLP